MEAEGPFAPYPADPLWVEFFGERIRSYGSQLATVGTKASQYGVRAGGVESFGLFDDVMEAVHPARIAGSRLKSVGGVAEYALSEWADRVREYDRTVAGLNEKWRVAKASDFGVDALQLERSELTPDAIDTAVENRSAAIGEARGALWSDLQRRQRKARDRLDQGARKVASLLENAGDPSVQEEVALERQRASLVRDATQATGLRDVGRKLNPVYWQALAQGFPIEIAERLADASAYPAGPMGETPSLADTFAMVFGDPRACFGDDAAWDACGLEAAGLLPLPAAKLAQLRKLGELGKYGDEVADGLGAWTKVNENMSKRASAYQRYVTGIPDNVSYKLNGVKFDGYDGEKLIDAKDHYEQFAKNGRFQGWWKHGADAMVDQAERQTKAAGRTDIEWWVSNKESAGAIRRLLVRRGYDNIKVVYRP